MDRKTLLKNVIGGTLYDCFHSISQPSMCGKTFGELKDYVTRHINEAIDKHVVEDMPHTAVLWLQNEPRWPDTFEVICNGVKRTDYERIRSDKTHRLGLAFYRMTEQEICDVSIRIIPRSRQEAEREEGVRP